MVGTKEEMQRLLDDASKISGIKYDINSYADVTQAIHVMQESMGIAGTTAKEASTTISGSINSMKGAWTNFLTGLSSGKDIGKLLDNLVDTVMTSMTNLMPIIQKALDSIIAILPEILNKIIEFLPQILQSGQQILTSLIQGLNQNLPQIINVVMQILMMIVNTILQNLPQIIEMGLQIIIQLALRNSSSFTDINSCNHRYCFKNSRYIAR